MLTKRERRIINTKKNCSFALKTNTISAKNMPEKILNTTITENLPVIEYNGIKYKGVISLTSWKARIKTVYKTLESLVNHCQGFHIVLCLSELEFPKKEKELPRNILLYVEKYNVELLWVYKNYKAFKKMLFTMDKYRNVPVISADDDCYYIKNFAEELYIIWANNQDSFVTNTLSSSRNGIHVETWGYATLHPPFAYGSYGLEILEMIDFSNPMFKNDDMFYACLRRKLKKEKIISMKRNVFSIAKFHDQTSSISNLRRQLRNDSNEYSFYIKVMGLSK